jgi:hypothetical protein
VVRVRGVSGFGFDGLDPEEAGVGVSGSGSEPGLGVGVGVGLVDRESPTTLLMLLKMRLCCIIANAQLPLSAARSERV